MNKVMKKKCILFFLSLLSLIILISCEKNKVIGNETIDTSLVISSLSDEDFANIGTTNVIKEDFKKVNFIFNMKHNEKITKRTISVPIFKDVVNTYDKTERYWFGNNTRIDNISENYAYYETTFIMYTGNLSEDEITNIFRSESILVSYMENDKNKKELISVEKILKYEK